MARIRRLLRDDWALFKAVRLEMLADSPLAYLETLSAARRQTDTQWQERAAAMSSGSNVTLVADGGPEDPRVRGLMRVVLDEQGAPGRDGDGERTRRAMLLSVYVAPAYRGLGLAEDLLEEACRVAARDLGATILELGVHEDNARAKAFYLRHGFSFTGHSKPFPQAPGAHGPRKFELTMERPLSKTQAEGDPQQAGLSR